MFHREIFFFYMKTRMRTRIILQRNVRSATKLTSGNHAEGFALQCFSWLLRGVRRYIMISDCGHERAGEF